MKIIMTVSSVYMDPGNESERSGLGLWGIALGEAVSAKEVSI